MAAFSSAATTELLRGVRVEGIGAEAEKAAVVLSYETQLAALHRQLQRLSAAPRTPR